MIDELSRNSERRDGIVLKKLKLFWCEGWSRSRTFKKNLSDGGLEVLSTESLRRKVS